MPYKDLAKQREAQKRYALENKERIAEIQATRRTEMRKYLQDFKTGKECMDCEIIYPYYMLDLDHREKSDKLFNVSAIATAGSMARLIAELDKCDLVCANCHRHRTFMRGDNISGRIV